LKLITSIFSSVVMDAKKMSMLDDNGRALEAYRNYLHVLANLQLNPRAARVMDASDIVQQTLLEAHQARARFHGKNGGQLAAWLREILACNLRDALRTAGRDCRDVARQQSLEASLGASSQRLGEWLAADQSSPSMQAERNEQAVLLANALTALPEAQRAALILQHWHGWTLDQIAKELGRTPAAVAGLLKRGLQHLRKALQPQT
jgi:RNA polymerase sigma-70 factor, ECF subfamily